MVGCKAICHRYKAVRRGIGATRYLVGQKRCQMCQIFLDWQGLYCPCCGFKLRTKPRGARFKKKLREMLSSSQSTPSPKVDKKEEDG